jgi:hypothetical protein
MKCPKCKFRWITQRWHNNQGTLKSCDPDDNVTSKIPHMHYSCTRCWYDWIE